MRDEFVYHLTRPETGKRPAPIDRTAALRTLGIIGGNSRREIVFAALANVNCT